MTGPARPMTRRERREARRKALEARGIAAAACSCPSVGGSLRWPCPVHPPTAEAAELSATESARLAREACDGAAASMAAAAETANRCAARYAAKYHAKRTTPDALSSSDYARRQRQRRRVRVAARLALALAYVGTVTAAWFALPGPVVGVLALAWAAVVAGLQIAARRRRRAESKV